MFKFGIGLGAGLVAISLIFSCGVVLGVKAMQDEYANGGCYWQDLDVNLSKAIMRNTFGSIVK